MALAGSKAASRHQRIVAEAESGAPSSPSSSADFRRRAAGRKRCWKTVPRVTQRKAGPQPQITATAGPTIGEAPATEVKWWPHSTNLLVGT